VVLVIGLKAAITRGRGSVSHDSYSNERITTVARYIEEVLSDYEALGRQPMVWYRGHMREDWKLVPRIMRGEYDPEYENTLLQLFRSKVRSCLTSSENRARRRQIEGMARHAGDKQVQ
jgi:hypothetical protein